MNRCNFKQSASTTSKRAHRSFLSHIFETSARTTDTQSNLFFIKIQNSWALADKFCGIWGIFSQTISNNFGTVIPLSMMLIISPKRKNTILEMALKSFILSKLDHQMSKSWKRIVAHELQTTSRFDLLKNWVPDCSAQDRISAKSF